jgi:hypothetical protein
LSWGNLQFSVSIFYVMLITWVVALHVGLQQETLALLLEKLNMKVAIHNLQHSRNAVYCVTHGLSMGHCQIVVVWLEG